ncbi:MAG: type II secretion system F family protein [bacterium]
MIKIDLPIPDSLEKISATMRKKRIGSVLEEVTRDIRSGWSFSKAIARQQGYFPPLYLSMIKAGEETGNLSKVLHQLISHFQKITNLRNKIINTLIYPSILIIISFMVVIFILTFTVPIAVLNKGLAIITDTSNFLKAICITNKQMESVKCMEFDELKNHSFIVNKFKGEVNIKDYEDGLKEVMVITKWVGSVDVHKKVSLVTLITKKEIIVHRRDAEAQRMETNQIAD